MYSAPELAFKYLKYFIRASNGRGHGIHSPFVYEFIRQVLMDHHPYPAYTLAENYREQVLQDNRQLEVLDLGAGSAVNSVVSIQPGRQVIHQRKVADIARTSVKPKRYSRLLFRLARFYGYGNIIELGTSLGVTTTYFSQVPGLEKLITIEGSEAIAEYAEAHFRSAGIPNTILVRGNFDDVLTGALDNFDRLDLAFVDGNHRKQPTIRYFNQILEKTHENSCIVFDDIHWSAEMEEAWAEIKKDPRVKLSIDLFFVGIIFFRKSFLEKQDFMIRF